MEWFHKVPMSRRRGFTLVEMMLVMVIVGIVMAIALPAVQSYIERGRRAQALTDLQEMSDKIRKSEKSTGALPDTLNALALDTRLDPWGHPYAYFNIRTNTGNGVKRKDKKLAPLNSDFDLYSKGPDGITAPQLNNSASRDDLIRARDGGFIGTAEEFDP